MDDEPLIKFYRVLPALYPWRDPTYGKPRRAPPAGVGALPFKAVQYCEPSRLATSLGYYVFLPMTISICWLGGREFQWSWKEDKWYHLTEEAFPHSFSLWDALAPDECKGFCPPFVSVNQDESLQMWTGWFARTRPGYSSLIMPPLNLAPSPHYHIYSGIIETDRWFGPLFTNVQFKTRDVNVQFDATWPFVQVVPLARSAYAAKHFDNFALENTLSEDFPWADYHRTLIAPRVTDKPEQGHYAKLTRRRAKRE